MTRTGTTAPPLPLAHPADRAARHRLDEQWLAAAWRHPATLVFAVSGGLAEVRDLPDGGARLVPLPPGDLAADQADRYFLGTDEQGAGRFAVRRDALPDRADAGVRGAGLRDAAGLLPAAEAGLLAHAVALEHWHRTHRFCPNCGGPTTAAWAGHLRRCPACAAEHHPRTDPSVIMLVTDDRDRALLTRRAGWPAGRFSIPAGFVEAAESAEHAVVREAAEETGVAVGAVEFVASQPWPFPSSLMLGFLARAVSTEIAVDGEEIAEARWFSRAEVRAGAASGELRLPPAVSLAARLLEIWYGGRLPHTVRAAGTAAP
ncbi:NAD+ diphosphatase [Streptomyces sp. TLI_235]|nr:NAD(+) diphosphatase [Streptomyces sp. TLI_235]PBC78962.1 NAD+ diphosphatase [Streptomyces sp. TLI_235]